MRVRGSQGHFRKFQRAFIGILCFVLLPVEFQRDTGMSWGLGDVSGTILKTLGDFQGVSQGFILLSWVFEDKFA